MLQYVVNHVIQFLTLIFMLLFGSYCILSLFLMYYVMQVYSWAFENDQK
jgi:hypothetical protein